MDREFSEQMILPVVVLRPSGAFAAMVLASTLAAQDLAGPQGLIPAGQKQEHHADILPVPGLAAKIAQARALLTRALSEVPGISVAVALNGEVVWAEGLGLAEVKTRTPTNSDHVFRFYSLSKWLTGSAARLLIQEGKLDAAQPVSRYVPGLPDAYQGVTVAQLISHTAGVRHYKKGEWLKVSQQHRTRPVDALAPFISDDLLFKPGGSYEYSSFGYVLLSAIIESAASRPFAEYMQQTLFLPADAASIMLDNPAQRGGHEAGYYETRSPGQFVEAEVVDNSGKFGAGGFTGTARDLARVCSQLLDGKLLGSAAYLHQEFPIVMEKEGRATRYSYGLFQVRAQATNELVLYHTGSGVGGAGSLAIMPNKGVTAVVLANAETDKLRSSSIDIAKIFAQP